MTPARLSLLGAILFATLILRPPLALSSERIATIEIRNGTRAPTEQILSILPFREGDVFESSLLDQAVSYLKKWGRFDTVEIKKTRQRDGVRLMIILKEGYLISGIDIHGGYPYLSSRLRRLLNIHSGELYDATKAEEQKEKLAHFFERKGYAGTTIDLSAPLNPSKGTVNLNYHIHKGFRYRLGQVTVLGGRLFPQGYFVSQLNPYLFYEPRRFKDRLDKIRRDYQKKGYLRARVRLKDLGTDSKTRKIHPVLEIEEGKRVTVVFSGNRLISRRTFKKTIPMYTEGGYSDYEIHGSVQTMLDEYHRRGFQKAAITVQKEELGNNRLRVRFLIEEGPQTRVRKARAPSTVDEGPVTRIDQIEFEGNHHLPPKKLRKSFQIRRRGPFSQDKVDHDKQQIVITYANQGYPYAQVNHELVEKDGKTVLVYRIEEGREARIGEVLVVGNERTSERAVRRALLLKSGQPFSYKKLLESESVLRRTGSFKTARVETIGLAEKEAIVHLVVKLEEYRRIVLDLGATYDTDDQFTGNVTATYLNLFEGVKRGIAKTTVGRDLQRGELIYLDPFFLAQRLEASVSAFAEKQRRPGFDATDVGGAFSLLKEFTPQLSFLSRYGLTRTLLDNVTDATGAQEEDHTISKFSFSLNYDRRDSFADPQKGFVAFAGVDIANKVFVSAASFLQPKASFAFFQRLGNRVTVMNYFRLEGIHVFGTDDLTRDQKLFLGGDYSVRGFDEDALGPLDTSGDPLGGQLLAVHTLELQTRLAKNFKCALFLDSGSISNRFSDFGLVSLRHSGGPGLRYVTPIGALRLDYGIKLDRKAGESFGRLHFAFGYAF